MWVDPSSGWDHPQKSPPDGSAVEMISPMEKIQQAQRWFSMRSSWEKDENWVGYSWLTELSGILSGIFRVTNWFEISDFIRDIHG